jgi:GTPase Era involved in 16S rRNA processing/energy-coupling factor transporter ATP-binding protein EcfA2
MPHPFQFQTAPLAGSDTTEANVFVHGYSAGHSDEDKQLLLEKIPDHLKHYTNIFAFWPSNHLLRFDKSSLWAIGGAGLNFARTMSSSPFDSFGLAGAFAKDRLGNFTQARTRAEQMGAVLFDQLQDYLLSNHPKIKTINLIGHSLGGRLVISSLKSFSYRKQLAINDVLLMAAAVEVTAMEARRLRERFKGRLINAYSKADRTLLLNWGETCLGRNKVEHFESIEMNDFGHTDYWERLPEVLAQTRFKAHALGSSELAQTDAEELLPPLAPEQPAEEHDMKRELNNPRDVYQQINDELALIIGELRHSSDDEALNLAREEAVRRLTEHRTALFERLAELEKNAEWNMFTIAFYGETGAGKSTLIETLRILLQEPGKRASQEAFRKLRDQHGLIEETLQGLQLSVEQTEARLQELTQQLNATLLQFEQPFRDAQSALDQANVRSSEVKKRLGGAFEQHEQSHKEALAAVARLHTLLATRKSNVSLWQALLNLFRTMPEEFQLNEATASLIATTAARDSAAATLDVEQTKAEQARLEMERQLGEIATRRDDACAALSAQQAEATQQHRALTLEQLEHETRLAELLGELQVHADGQIIGHGLSDFTRETQRYEFELDGQPFALLDVPGIEGKEGLVLDQIERAVQTAHAVFYVTNQAAPPQTGDGKHQGTLEKIKQHLGAQTEVWTIFNKKITNPKHSLTDRPLVSDDETASLAGLDQKMSEQLGKHYQNVFPLSALPAFLASTDHFSPGSQNAKRRSKVLEDFGADELLEKSRLRLFLDLLGRQLIHNGKAKIIRANFKKANDALNHTTQTLSGVQQTLKALSEKLSQEEQSAKSQLTSSFGALKKRLESCGETLIDNFASKVRNDIYARIDKDISNDTFKSALTEQLETQQRQLSKKLPVAVHVEVDKFQKAAVDILSRFEKHAQELTSSYGKLGSMRFNQPFNLNIKIDNGINVAGLLASLVGIAAAPFTGGASLWLVGASVLTALVSIGKAVWSALSKDYKMSQQRRALDTNLRSATEQLRGMLRESLDSALSEMQKTIDQLDLALEAPAKQAANQVSTLSRSTIRLKTLSRQIELAGNL